MTQVPEIGPRGSNSSATSASWSAGNADVTAELFSIPGLLGDGEAALKAGGEKDLGAGGEEAAGAGAAKASPFLSSRIHQI